VYAPRVEDIYPPGVRLETPRLPSVATMPGLEDAKRPGHFAGVCQVVDRLFTLVRPTAAVFGEKDWQQLQVISAMTRESNLPIEIVPGETVREPDGLAISSRNRFLSAEDRVKGLSLSRALRAACDATSPNQAEAIMRRELELAGIEVEYAVVRDARTLMPIDAHARAGRSLIAVRVGPGGTSGTSGTVGGVGVRLIDNAPWHARAS
jgi:pantoate--beta-alanine ligase